MPDVSLMKFFVDEVFAELKESRGSRARGKRSRHGGLNRRGRRGLSRQPARKNRGRALRRGHEERCSWARDDLARRYHDEEWGVPFHEDHRLFEFIVLEGAQAGLSWDTILRKRDSYREAFDDFDPALIARYDARRVERLLKNADIVRNRLKIVSAIQNARAFLKVKEEFGSFDKYLWGFVGGAPKRNAWKSSQGSARGDTAGRGDEQGPAQARLQLRRADNLLRFHAGGRHGQRSPGRLLSLRGNPLGSFACRSTSESSPSARRARRYATGRFASRARRPSARTIIPKSRCIPSRSRSTWIASMPTIGRAARELILRSARKLADVGADFLICPDNTAHQSIDLIIDKSPLPWLHIAREVASSARARGYRRIGVLGTKYLMEGPVYPPKLAVAGIAHEIPSAEDRERINTIIFEELVYGRFEEPARRFFQDVIVRLNNRGCDAVALSCTEIPLLISEQDSALPTLDSTRILARAALREAAV